MRLQDDINKSLHIKCNTIGIFIDLEKAFDMIWREGLLHKLHALGICDNIYHWIKDFLSDRTIQVRVGQVLSEKMTPGKRKSSRISFEPTPIPNIMLNDLPDTQETVKLSDLC